MFASILSLLAATAYGVGDFFGTVGTRRSHPILVSFIGHIFYAITALVGLWVFQGTWTSDAITFGIATGASEAIGFLVFYFALGMGQVSLVAPLVSVIYAVVPVVWGLVSGDSLSPLGWVGLGIGLLAVLFLSVETGETNLSSKKPLFIVLSLALVGGIMWGLSTVTLSYVPEDSGMVPVFIAGLTAFVLLAATVLVRRKMVIPQWNGSALVPSMFSGLLFGIANLLIVTALRFGSLSLVGLLTALYPLATVLLARFLLHEPTSRTQWVGVALAITAAALLSQTS